MPEVPGASPHPAFQGIPTFLSTPLVETASDLARLKADVAIIAEAAHRVVLEALSGWAWLKGREN